MQRGQGQEGGRGGGGGQTRDATAGSIQTRKYTYASFDRSVFPQPARFLHGLAGSAMRTTPCGDVTCDLGLFPGAVRVDSTALGGGGGGGADVGCVWRGGVERDLQRVLAFPLYIVAEILHYSISSCGTAVLSPAFSSA